MRQRSPLQLLVSGALTVLLFAAWWTVLRPTAMGGPVTYTVVSGRSMEPAFHGGDYVVARAGDGYATGDVIAFRAGGGLVLHRIVGGDGERGYVTRGDNNLGVDPWRPTNEEVLGSVVLHIPQVGEFVSLAQRPLGIGVAAGSMTTLLLVLGDSPRRRRRRPEIVGGGMSFDGSPPLRERLVPGRRRSRSIGSHRWAMVVLGIVAVGLAIIVVQSFRVPATETLAADGVAYRHEASFAYTATVEPSSVYPSQTIGPVTADVIDDAPPLYTRLMRSIVVDFSYQFESGTDWTVDGVLTTDVRVRAGDDGWEAALPGPTAQALEDGSATLSVPVDVQGLVTMIARAEEETGDVAGTYRLTIAPSVVIDGEVDGSPISERFDAALDFDVSAGRIELVSELTGGRSVSLTTTFEVPTSIELPLVTLDTGRLRTVAVAGLIVVLASLVAATAASPAGRRLAIRARYGSLIVPVSSYDVADDRHRISVPSIGDLARLAKANSGLILVQESPPGVYTYTVAGEATRYEYVSGHRRRP